MKAPARLRVYAVSTGCEACQNCINTKPSGRLSPEISGPGVESQETEDGPSIWHWGDNGGSGFHCYVVGYRSRGFGVVVFTKNIGGHGIIPDTRRRRRWAAAIPPSRGCDYERWNSPARTWFKEILARGEPAVAELQGAQGRGSPPRPDGAAGQQGGLLGSSRKRSAGSGRLATEEARGLPFLERPRQVGDPTPPTVSATARSKNEKSLCLNPANADGAEQLRKLESPPPARIDGAEADSTNCGVVPGVSSQDVVPNSGPSSPIHAPKNPPPESPSSALGQGRCRATPPPPGGTVVLRAVLQPRRRGASLRRP